MNLFPCGHPHTKENTAFTTCFYETCKTCRNKARQDAAKRRRKYGLMTEAERMEAIRKGRERATQHAKQVQAKKGRCCPKCGVGTGQKVHLRQVTCGSCGYQYPKTRTRVAMAGQKAERITYPGYVYGAGW